VTESDGGGADRDLIDLDFVRQFFREAIAFNRLVGLELVDLSRGKAAVVVPFKPELVGDPVRPALHGGVISMLADTVGGAAVFTLTRPGDKVATIDLRVDYLRPARLEELRGEAEVLRIGNRVGVASVKVFQPSGGRDQPVAVAMAVFTVRRAGDS
jgi:uncharacterized protein (TIGR00369 family)